MVAHPRGPDFLRQGLDTETVVADSDNGLIIPASQAQREDKDRKGLVGTLRKDSRAARAFPEPRESLYHTPRLITWLRSM